MRCARWRRSASPRSRWARAAARAWRAATRNLFAEALAVQLDLTGVTAPEIMRRAARDRMPAPPSLPPSTPPPRTIATAARACSPKPSAAIGRCRALHAALARHSILRWPEASHNRVLRGAAHLAAARLVAAPQSDADAEGRAPRPRRAHANLPGLIEMRDGAGARRLMDDHVKMIRARRVDRGRDRSDASTDCASTGRRTEAVSWNVSQTKEQEDIMAKDKFIIEPHFRLQEWVAEEKGYFKDEGLDYDLPRTRQVDRRRIAATSATRSARTRRSRRAASPT